MVAIMWSVWKHHNLKLLQNENELCAHMIDRARYLMEDWQTTNSQSSHVSNISRTQDNKLFLRNS